MRGRENRQWEKNVAKSFIQRETEKVRKREEREREEEKEREEEEEREREEERTTRHEKKKNMAPE